MRSELDPARSMGADVLRGVHASFTTQLLVSVVGMRG